MDLKSKRILVTGGAGFLGGHVVKALSAYGVPRQNIAIPRSRNCDLRIWENCKKAVEGIDLVIHLAAITGDPKFHRQAPGRIFYDNLIMGTQLMEAARQTGVEKFVNIGSVAEYPADAPLPYKEEDLWRGLPEKIHLPYALAKKSLLIQAQAYSDQYDFRGTHLLIANMYGEGAVEGVIPSLIRRILKAKKKNEISIEAWGTGKPSRDFLYVGDAAEGIILATVKYDKADPVNLGSAREVTIRDLVEFICHLVDYRGEIKWDTSKPDGRPRSILDISRAEREFDFKPKTSLEEGLRKTIEWYNNQLV